MSPRHSPARRPRIAAAISERKEDGKQGLEEMLAQGVAGL